MRNPDWREMITMWTGECEDTMVSKDIAELFVTFVSEEYFEIKLVFPDGSFRKLYIAHKALLPKMKKAL